MKMIKSNIFKLALIVIAVFAFSFNVSAEETENMVVAGETIFNELSHSCRIHNRIIVLD